VDIDFLGKIDLVDVGRRLEFKKNQTQRKYMNNSKTNLMQKRVRKLLEFLPFAGIKKLFPVLAAILDFPAI
jgi:hypothetical protein